MQAAAAACYADLALWRTVCADYRNSAPSIGQIQYNAIM
jgi:hypothetical protein